MHLILMHFIHIFQCLKEFIHKIGFFFKFVCVCVWFFFFFFQNFDRSRLFFDQSKFIQNFWVRFYLFQLIEPKVSINRKSCGTFFKTRFLDGSNTFSKSFLPFLSPCNSVKENLHFFVVFDLSFCKVFLSPSP